MSTTVRCFCVLITFLLFLITPSYVISSEDFLDRPLGVTVLPDASVLITDGGGVSWSNNGSELYRINTNNEVVWKYSNGLLFAHSAVVLSDNTILVTDTGHDRVIIIDPKTNDIVFTSDTWGNNTGTLSDGSHLDYPNSAKELINGHLLITDRNNNRFIEVDKAGYLYFSYDKLNKPHNADKLINGNYLVSDSENHTVKEIASDGSIVWQYGTGNTDFLNWPRDADRLTNGNTLITDSRNHRVIEVTPDGEIVWEYTGNLYWPFEADRLADGTTVISGSQIRGVLFVDANGNEIRIIRMGNKPVAQQFQNGDFEDYHAWDQQPGKPTARQMRGDQVFSFWTPGVLLSEGHGLLGIDTAVVKNGKTAAYVENDATTSIFWVQRATVKPGKKYIVSGFIQTAIESDSPTGARLELSWEDSYGAFINQQEVSPWQVGDKKWKKVQIVTRAPDNAEFIQIRTTLQAPGKAWFDAITFQEEQPIHTYILYIVSGSIGYFLFQFLRRNRS